MNQVCAKCNNRRWLETGDATAPARRCACSFGTCELAAMLGVHRSDLWRVRALRAGAVISTRVLEAVARVFPGEIAA